MSYQSSGYPSQQQGGWQQPYQQQPPASYQQQLNNQMQYYNGPPPAYSFYPPTNDNKNNYSFDDAFKPKKQWNDLWAGLLFLVVQGGFIVVSVLALSSYSSTSRAGHGIYDGKDIFGMNSNTAILFAFVLGTAFVLGYMYITLAHMFPKQFIWVSSILNIILAFATAIYYIVDGTLYAGIVFLVFAVFLCICFISWHKRIPFSALMLEMVVDIAKDYGHVWIVSFLGGLIGVAFGAWFSVTLVGLYVRYDGSSNSKLIGLIVYITFAIYWFSEWLKYTIHTAVSGVYASWYFSSRNFPHRVTRSALGRALTTSFGSISLGSLLTALIQALRQLVQVAQGQAQQDDNTLCCIVFCCLNYILGFVQWTADFINRFAFSHIALYGTPYIQAAKDTWNVIKQRGIDALVNDCLIGPVFSIGAVMIGYITSLFAYLYLKFTDPVYNQGGNYTAVIMAFSFLIGMQVTNLFTVPLGSGIDTIFVAVGWDPAVMQREHPEFWNAMVKVYPTVVNQMQV